MGLYRIYRNIQLLGNFLIAAAFNQQPYDLFLPLGDSQSPKAFRGYRLDLLIGEDVPPADEVVEIHRKNRKTQVDQLERRAGEEE